MPFADRGRRTDEYVAAMRALWSGRPTDFSGDFVNFQACISRPAPAAPVPIHIGGHSIAAARRAGRLGDGFFPGRGSHAELKALIDTVRETAVKSDRDPDAIEITSGGSGAFGDRALSEVEALANIGVGRVIVPAFLFWSDPEAQLAEYGEQVISASS